MQAVFKEGTTKCAQGKKQGHRTLPDQMAKPDLEVVLLLVSYHLLHDRHILLNSLECVPDLALELARGHLHEAFELCPVTLFAKIQIGRATAWAQVLVGKFLEIVVAAATVVIFKLGGITILDAWVASHLVLLTQLLTFCGAVHIGDQGCWGALEVIHQLVPIGLQLLAVSSPRCQKLDENSLARGLGIPIRRRQFNARGTDDESGCEKSSC